MCCHTPQHTAPVTGGATPLFCISNPSEFSCWKAKSNREPLLYIVTIHMPTADWFVLPFGFSAADWPRTSGLKLAAAFRALSFADGEFAGHAFASGARAKQKAAPSRTALAVIVE